MAETMPTFVPGDYITYVVYLAYPGNLRGVRATFRKEKSGDSISLEWSPYPRYSSDWSEAGWEEQLSPHPTVKGTRTHAAILSTQVADKTVYTKEQPHVGKQAVEKEPSIYRLVSLEAETFLQKTLKIPDPPRAAFRIEDEPDATVLPSSAVLPPTGFH